MNSFLLSSFELKSLKFLQKHDSNISIIQTLHKMVLETQIIHTINN
jgi:hypothetical protein